MILAAYMVTGFLVASIYAVGMLKGRRDRLHRLGLLIPLTIACIATPIQLFVGDTAAREVADHQPAKFAGMECIQKTGTHQTEYVGGICTDDGVKGGDPDPRPRLLPGRLQRRHQGHRAGGHPRRRTAAGQHPAAPRLRRDGRDRHARCSLLGAWLAFVWWRRRDIPQTPWFLRAVAVSGAGAVARALVRLDRHRGRPPALDRPGLHAHLRSGDRGRGDLVQLRRRAAALRGARDDRDPRPARACRAAGARARTDAETATPRTAPPCRRPKRTEARREQGRRRRGDPLGRGDLLRALRRRRLRRRASGTWSPAAPRRASGRGR